MLFYQIDEAINYIKSLKTHKEEWYLKMKISPSTTSMELEEGQNSLQLKWVQELLNHFLNFNK